MKNGIFLFSIFHNSLKLPLKRWFFINIPFFTSFFMLFFYFRLRFARVFLFLNVLAIIFLRFSHEITTLFDKKSTFSLLKQIFLSFSIKKLLFYHSYSPSLQWKLSAIKIKKLRYLHYFSTFYQQKSTVIAMIFLRKACHETIAIAVFFYF